MERHLVVGLRAWSVVCAILLAPACTDDARYAVVTVADPEGIAATAASLLYGSSLETLRAMTIGGEEFPLTFGLRSQGDRSDRVWVEARDAGGLVLGRGVGTVALRRGSPSTVALELARPCDDDVDCSAVLSCRGRPACQERLCVYLDKTNLCTLPDGSNGWCEDSECVASVCGDARVDTRTESCDDQNQNPADGCDACATTTWVASSVLAGVPVATEADLASPWAVFVDARGDLYIADTGHHQVRKVNVTSGVIELIAGTGTDGFAGDGGRATAAQLNQPSGLAVDGRGNVFIADTANQRVRKVDATTREITTVAGNGNFGFVADDVLATSARLAYPMDVAVDGLGNLYIADWQNHRVRKVDVDTRVITTVAGGSSSGASGDGGDSRAALLNGPRGVSIDAAGALYIADTNNHRIRKVSGGVITTVAGTGCATPANDVACPVGDGGLATSAALFQPRAVSVDAQGNLFIADASHDRIRKVNAADGVISTVAGGPLHGAAGDGGPATSAKLAYPQDVAVDARGDLYIADRDNHRVRRVAAVSGVITTAAGRAAAHVGLRLLATSVELQAPGGVAIGVAGELYVSDSVLHRVWRRDAGSDLAAVVAGTGTAGFSGDGEAAVNAELRGPEGLAVDAAGDLYIADGANARVRRVDAATGWITTFAGTGVEGESGDGGLATDADLNAPCGLAVGPGGDVFIADRESHRVRRVDASSGVITTVAGVGTPGYNGDGVAAASAQLNRPSAVAVDLNGNVYIADANNFRVRRVDASTGFIATVAGTGIDGSSGDGGQATAAQISQPLGLALDQVGGLYFTDATNRRVRRVDTGTGIISTITGTSPSASSGDSAGSGDGGAATSATVNTPNAVGADGVGNVYIADLGAHGVRMVSAATGTISTVLGRIDPVGMGPLARGRLANPQGLTNAPNLGAWLVAGGSSGTVQALRPEEDRLEVVAGRYPQAGAVGALARFRGDAFSAVGGIAYDSARGLIYISESSSNRLSAVPVVDPADETSWTIAPLAGDAAAGAEGFLDGAAAGARFRNPTGLWLDELADVLYIADTSNHVVRELALAELQVRTIAGTPETLGFFGDGNVATQAGLHEPMAVTRCPNGDFFIADTGNNRVRRVDPGGVVTSVLGDGSAASSGQGLPARTFPVHAPQGLACDTFGNLFVTSRTTLRVLLADDSHVVDGSGSVQTVFGAARPKLPLEELSSCLSGVALVAEDTLRLADACEGLLLDLVRMRAVSAFPSR